MDLSVEDSEDEFNPPPTEEDGLSGNEENTPAEDNNPAKDIVDVEGEV